MWSSAAWVVVTSAMRGRGSMAPVSVVPAVATTMAGPGIWLSALSRVAGSRVPSRAGRVTGWGSPRSQAARWMLWWVVAAHTVWMLADPLVRARSLARRRAWWLESVPPVVTMASGAGWPG